MAIGTDGNIGKDPNSSTSQDINTPDIDGGTADSLVIGGTTPAAGAFTTVNVTESDHADTTLSGTPKVLQINIDGTPYYFKAYPTKA